MNSGYGRTGLLLLLFALPLAAREIAGWDNTPLKAPELKVKTFWRDGFEGTIDDYCVSYRDGARGSVELCDSVARSGKKSLKITKSNAAGYILVRPKKTFRVPPKTRLQAGIYVHGVQTDVEHSMSFLRLYGKNEDLTYFRKLDGRGGAGIKMQLLCASNPGEFERKLAHRIADEECGEVITPAIVVTGNPSVSCYDDWVVEDFRAACSAWRKEVGKQVDSNRSGVMIPREQFVRELAQSADHTAEVVSLHGRSVLAVDGQAVPFSPFVSVVTGGPDSGKFFVGAKLLEDAGIDLQVVLVRFADTPRRSGFWNKKGFDVAGAVERIEQAMRVSPRSKFILMMTLDAYPEFTAEHPESIWYDEKGRIVYGNHIHSPQSLADSVPAGSWPWVSIHSVQWRNAVKGHLTSLIDALKKNGMSKRVVGVHLAGYHDNQFACRHLDCGPAATAGFRKYLAKRYGTAEALRRAWKLPAVDFANAVPPKFASGECLEPETRRSEADFWHFTATAAQGALEEFAAHIKRCFGKKIVAGRYCMGAYVGNLYSGYDIGAFLNSSSLDFLLSPASYARRAPGLPLQLRGPAASFHFHRKILFSDFDVRTYAARSGNETELRVLGLAQATHFAMFDTMLHKMAGQMLALGVSFRYVDIANGWFNRPEIAGAIASVDRIGRRLLSEKKASKWRPDTAFLIDEAGLLLRNIPYYYYAFGERFIVAEQQQYLAAAGVPFETYVLDDWLRHPELAEPYKTVVFAGMYHIDAKRKALLEQLRRKPRTLVYLAGTGRISRTWRHTGFSMTEKRPPAGHELKAEATEAIPLVSPVQIYRQSNFLGGKVRAYFQPTRFSAMPEAKLQIHYRYADDDGIAVASQKSGLCRSIMIGAPGALSAELFHQIVSSAGGCVVTRPGIQVDMSDRFMSIHGILPGKFTFKLPFKAKVVNLKDHSTVLERGDEFTLDVRSGTTYWLHLEP